MLGGDSMLQMLVGIDVSLRSHHVQFMNKIGESLVSFSISNISSGANTLLRLILDIPN
ncbi:MAG: hypothetical protein ACOX4L_00070 [Bacillota bacterium]|jgi:hypothetical protein